MFMAFMTLVIVASVPLCRGRLGRLAEIRIRYTWVILVALAVQILITVVVPSAPHVLLVAAHVATYVLAAFVVWANRRLPGLVVIGVGAMLNAVTITLNDGTLPASPTALASAGIKIDPGEFANSGEVHHPVLAFLGDIMATPHWLPFPNVISLGDIIILVGATVLLHGVTRSALARCLERLRSRWSRTVPHVDVSLAQVDVDGDRRAGRSGGRGDRPAHADAVPVDALVEVHTVDPDVAEPHVRVHDNVHRLRRDDHDLPGGDVDLGVGRRGRLGQRAQV
jgi:hypothetical protein